MATKLKSYKFIPKGKSAVYDWDKLLDGSIWELRRGKDFNTGPISMRCAAYIAAARRGIKVRCSVSEDRVVLQAYTP